MSFQEFRKNFPLFLPAQPGSGGTGRRQLHDFDRLHEFRKTAQQIMVGCAAVAADRPDGRVVAEQLRNVVRTGVPDVAVEAPGENTRNEWCEPVSDEEYASLG